MQERVRLCGESILRNLSEIDLEEIGGDEKIQELGFECFRGREGYK